MLILTLAEKGGESKDLTFDKTEIRGRTGPGQRHRPSQGQRVQAPLSPAAPEWPAPGWKIWQYQRDLCERSQDRRGHLDLNLRQGLRRRFRHSSDRRGARSRATARLHSGRPTRLRRPKQARSAQPCPVAPRRLRRPRGPAPCTGAMRVPSPSPPTGRKPMSPCHRPRRPPGEKARPFLWWQRSRFLRLRCLTEISLDDDDALSSPAPRLNLPPLRPPVPVPTPTPSPAPDEL